MFYIYVQPHLQVHVGALLLSSPRCVHVAPAATCCCLLLLLLCRRAIDTPLSLLLVFATSCPRLPTLVYTLGADCVSKADPKVGKRVVDVDKETERMARLFLGKEDAEQAKRRLKIVQVCMHLRGNGLFDY